MKKKYDNPIIVNEVIFKWKKLTTQEKESLVQDWIDSGQLQEYFYDLGYTDDAGVEAEESCDYELAEEIYFEKYWFYKTYIQIEEDFKKLIGN